MAEITIAPDSILCGLSLKEARFPEKCGLLVIAMKKRLESLYCYNPVADERIENSDTIVVLGYADQIRQARKLAGPV